MSLTSVNSAKSCDILLNRISAMGPSLKSIVEGFIESSAKVKKLKEEIQPVIDYLNGPTYQIFAGFDEGRKTLLASKLSDWNHARLDQSRFSSLMDDALDKIQDAVELYSFLDCKEENLASEIHTLPIIQTLASPKFFQQAIDQSISKLNQTESLDMRGVSLRPALA